MPCMEYKRWCVYKIWRFLDPLTHTHLHALGHSEHGSQGLTCSSVCFRAQEQLLSWLLEVSFPKEMLLKSCTVDLLGVGGASVVDLFLLASVSLLPHELSTKLLNKHPICPTYIQNLGECSGWFYYKDMLMWMNTFFPIWNIQEVSFPTQAWPQPTSTTI